MNTEEFSVRHQGLSILVYKGIFSQRKLFDTKTTIVNGPKLFVIAMKIFDCGALRDLVMLATLSWLWI